MLSRTVEDTGTVTSPLVPWNSCGAYMTGVLGVPTDAVPPVRVLQHPQPARRPRLRLHRLPRRAPRAPAIGASRRRRPVTSDDRATASPGGDVMSTDVAHEASTTRSTRTPPEAAPRKPRFTLPSAYTILFALIVITAMATWIIPAGQYDARPGGLADPGHVPRGRLDPVADHRRLAGGADQRAVRHRGSRRPATSTCSTAASCSAPSTSRSSSS